MVEPVDNSAKFKLKEYFNHPEKYKPCFEQYLPYLSLLVNAIYWTEDYPRFVTKEYLKSNQEYYNKLAQKTRFDSEEVIFIKRILQIELSEEVRNKIQDYIVEVLQQYLNSTLVFLKYFLKLNDKSDYNPELFYNVYLLE